MKSILYLQLGHLDSVYPLISTKVPHFPHLYNYKPPIILFMFLVAVLPIGVDGRYAPPVNTAPHFLHFHIPAETRFTPGLSH